MKIFDRKRFLVATSSLVLAGCGSTGMAVAPHVRKLQFEPVCGESGCPSDGGGGGAASYPNSVEARLSSGLADVDYDNAGANYSGSGSDLYGAGQGQVLTTLTLGSTTYQSSGIYSNSSGSQRSVGYTAPYARSTGQVDSISFSNGASAVRTIHSAMSASAIVTDEDGQSWSISVETTDGYRYNVDYSGPESGSFSFTIPSTAPSSHARLPEGVRHLHTAQCVDIMEHTASVLGHISAVATVASFLFVNPAFAIVAGVTGVVGWFYGTFAKQVCR